MDDLIAFLRARLDEDERQASAASPGPWSENAESDEVLAVDGITVCDGFALSGNQLRSTVAHIARHDPARVLREIEAKRRLLALHPRQEYRREWKGEVVAYHCDCQCPDGVIMGSWPCETMRLLALPYADHEDYQERWKP